MPQPVYLNAELGSWNSDVTLYGINLFKVPRHIV